MVRMVRMVRMVPRFPAPKQRRPERLPSPWSGEFLASAQTVSRVARPGLWFDLAPGTAQRL